MSGERADGVTAKRALQIAVAIPMGLLAATVLGNLVLLAFGVYKIDVCQPSGQVAALVILVNSSIIPVFLVRDSPSVRQTFRRSLPILGFPSFCLNSIVVLLVANGVRVDLETNGPLIDAISNLLATVVLLAPILCPVLYYWVVPFENRPPRSRNASGQGNSSSKKLVLTSLVIAGAVTLLGIAAQNPRLALLGIIGVVGLAIILIWVE